MLVICSNLMNLKRISHLFTSNTHIKATKFCVTLFYSLRFKVAPLNVGKEF